MGRPMPRRTKGRYFAGLSRNTFLLAFASLFADISTEMLYPVLPIFLTQTLKASGSIVGLVEGIAQATQNIVQGFSGWLSDKLQRRKPIALVGYTLAAVAKPLMGLATAWPGVLGGRFLDRLGAGTRTAPRDALIAASVEEKDRGKGFRARGHRRQRRRISRASNRRRSPDHSRAGYPLGVLSRDHSRPACRLDGGASEGAPGTRRR